MRQRRRKTFLVLYKEVSLTALDLGLAKYSNFTGLRNYDPEQPSFGSVATHPRVFAVSSALKEWAKIERGTVCPSHVEWTKDA